jgi:hypothetical protein
MNDQAGKFKFTIGGPVQVNSGTYLSRLADEHLIEACKAGKP